MAISDSSTFTKRNLRKIRSSAFTLIELVIVMGIIVILSTILIGYSRESGRQLMLKTAEAKFISLVSRAKFLSVDTFFQGQPPGATPKICAYGVSVNKESGEAFIFRDMDDECPSDGVFSESGDDTRLSGELNNIKLDTSIFSMSSGETTLNNIVFIPPDPKVRINAPDDERSAAVKVELTANTDHFFIITVNDAGQVTTQ